ncbi:MAG: GntR family transcriptional regulator [Oscillospiraceae bacterium]|nr:GntR family transcriptional regulator [Oscillospiraceae bacterium]
MNEYKSKVDIVYGSLLDRILNGTYNPGERMVISKMAREYGVSEIPVREAIRRLESEGYVTINANHGAVVKDMDTDQITQMFQIRGVLEGYATRVCVDYLQPEDFQKLEEINESMLRALKNDEASLYSELNIKFHLAIYECLPMFELYNMISDLWKKWQITSRVFNVAPSRASESYDEHKEILELLTKKEYDKVEMAVRRHKFKACQRFIEYSKNVSLK